MQLRGKRGGKIRREERALAGLSQVMNNITGEEERESGQEERKNSSCSCVRTIPARRDAHSE